MTTAKPAPDTEWFELNKKQWDGWFESQRKALDEQLAAYSGMQNEWSKVFNAWPAPATQTKSSASDYSSVFAQAGEQYLKFMQQFQQPGTAAQKPEDVLQQWIGGMQQLFHSLMHTQTQHKTPAQAWQSFSDEMIRKMPAYWDMIARQSHVSQKQDFSTPHFDPFGFAASVPGIGYSREKQEDVQKLWHLWKDHEIALSAYHAEMTKIGLLALNRFQEFLRQPPGEAKPLSSLKDIYTKWVDVCEEVYAHFAMTEEYTKIYGQTVNSLMAFRKQMNAMIDDAAEQMNLPTRKEIDSLHQRMHDMRRENRKLKEAVEKLLGEKK